MRAHGGAPGRDKAQQQPVSAPPRAKQLVGVAVRHARSNAPRARMSADWSPTDPRTRRNGGRRACCRTTYRGYGRLVSIGLIAGIDRAYPTKPNLVEILLHSQQLSSCLVGCVVHESQAKHNPRIGGSPQELLAQPNEWLCSASRQPSDVPEPRASGSAICRWTAACTRQWRRLSRS